MLPEIHIKTKDLQISGFLIRTRINIKIKKH